jgi:Conjugative transposon protein TcpC
MPAVRDMLRVERPGRTLTPRDLLAGVGRLALWLAVGLLLVRGAGAMLGPTDDARQPHALRAARVSIWPDDAAGALAVEFATGYLTHVPGDDANAAARQLTALAASDIASELAPRFDHDAPAQIVRSATVARTVTIDARHALITVAATLATDGQLSTRRLTVPVARDGAGRLVVDDLPSFAATPTRAAPAQRDDGPLAGAERAVIEDVLTRFLRSYLAGDTGGLAYLVAPAARIDAAAGGFELLSPISVTTTGPVTGRRRVVLVMARARDRASRALYTLRYRVELVRRDRWYVAELNEQGGAR